MIGLTPRMAECLAFIKSYKDSHACGSAPTYEEIRVGIGLPSTSGVHRLVNSLEQRGHIRRLRYRQRAIEIICPDRPDRTTDELADKVCAEVFHRLRAGEAVTVETLREIVRRAVA